MMTAAKWKVVGVMLIAVVTLSIGEALLSKGMKQSNAVRGGWWAQARGIGGNPYVLVGTALLIAYFGLNLLALRWADFSLVLPLTAASYPLSTLLAQFYLQERVSAVRWIGTLVITVGVAIVGWGEE